MSQVSPEDNINKLAEAATTSIREQDEKLTVLLATQQKPSRFKYVSTVLLMLILAYIAWVQYPKFHEPFGRPDASQNQEVAEADLTVIAMLVEDYRVAQGKYPDSLDQLQLPESQSTFVIEQKIAYQRTENSYVLDWVLPLWHIIFNGETGSFDVTSSIS